MSIQQALELMSQDSDRWVTIGWRNIANDTMWTEFHKRWSPREYFGQLSFAEKRSPEDLPVLDCHETWAGHGSWRTFWGSPDRPEAYLEEVAAYLHVLQKHWRLVSLWYIGPGEYYGVDDPWQPRHENAMRVVRRARAKARMDQHEAGELDLLQPPGKPALLQDLLGSWFQGRLTGR